MALVTRSTLASMDTSTAMYAPQIPGLVAGEALDMAAPCYIKASDGLVYMSNATGANEAAKVHGFTPRAVGIGQACSLFGVGTRFGYSASLLTPGAPYYTGATAGRLDDGATVGCAFPIAYAVSATDIIVVWAHGSPLTSATVGAGTISVTELANDAVETAKIKNVNVTEAKLAVGAAAAGLSGLVVKFAADANVIGAIPVVHRVVVAAGANGSVNVTLTHKTRVIDAWFVMKGGGTAGCTLQAKNAGTAITEALDCSASLDKAINRFATIDDGQHEIAAGAVLSFTKASTGGDFPGAEAYVLGLRVA